MERRLRGNIILELDVFNTSTFVGTSQLLTLGGDALPSFADLTAYESWRATVTSFNVPALLATPFAPGTPFDTRDIPNAVVTEDDNISGPLLPNLIETGAGNDTVLGGTDHDTLYGGDNNDRLIGGGGDDVMYGNSGNDTMNGNVGHDSLAGGLGDDLIRSGAGSDALIGAAGNDTMFGGRDGDFMLGGTGYDFMQGQHGNDMMFGGNNHDTLEGGAGRDRLVGGNGNDPLIGGADNDVLRGGAGADVFVFGFHHGQDRIADFTGDVDTLQITSGIYGTVSAMLGDAVEIDGDVILFTTGTSSGTPAQLLIQDITIAQLADGITLFPILV